MRHLTPLPRSLHGRVFTRAEAAQLQVSDHRLQAWDIRVHARGVYEHLATADQTTDREQLLAALCRKYQRVRISHQSAAELFDLPVPRRILCSEEIHLSMFHSTRMGLRDHKVKLHFPTCHPDETFQIPGIRASSPLRCAVDLMPYLTVFEMVVLLDHMLKVPRPWLGHALRSLGNAHPDR